MNDPNGFVRSASAEALGRSVQLPAQEVVAGLLSAIDDPNNYVCAAAVNSLGLLKAEQALAQVEACLDDPHPIVVQAAILAMARIAPERIKDRLVEFLQSDEYLIHLAAARACGWLSLHDCDAVILSALKQFMGSDHDQDFKLPKIYIEVLARLNMAEAIPTLVEIAEKEVGLRGVAVEALVEMGAEEAAAILSPLLNDPSNRLRRNLIEMMMQSDYASALPLIRPLLKDSAITVRETALAAVSKWRDLVAVDDVRDIAYSDPNPFVRPQAVLTLSKLLGQDALQDLIDLADDLNLHVRRAVAQGFANVSCLTPEAKRVLLHLSEDEDTAEFAQEALEVHDMDAVHPAPPPNPSNKIPVPEALAGDIKTLLDLLDSWQEALPEMQKDFDLEKLSEVDQALSLLIVYLRDAEETFE
jgi:HEAT repeat protein